MRVLWEKFRFVLATFSDVPREILSISGMFEAQSAVWDQRVGSSNLSTPTTYKGLKSNDDFRFCLSTENRLCESTVGENGSVREYQPKYKWRETWPGEGHQDFAAWDGETPVGRIRLEESGPMSGRWHWAGNGGPNVKRRLAPNTGYVATAREASRMVEEYYDRLREINGG